MDSRPFKRRRTRPQKRPGGQRVVRANWDRAASGATGRRGQSSRSAYRNNVTLHRRTVLADLLRGQREQAEREISSVRQRHCADERLSAQSCLRPRSFTASRVTSATARAGAGRRRRNYSSRSCSVKSVELPAFFMRSDQAKGDGGPDYRRSRWEIGLKVWRSRRWIGYRRKFVKSKFYSYAIGRSRRIAAGRNISPDRIEARLTLPWDDTTGAISSHTRDHLYRDWGRVRRARF
jgi:hypothetical protein